MIPVYKKYFNTYSILEQRVLDTVYIAHFELIELYFYYLKSNIMLLRSLNSYPNRGNE